MTGGVIESNSLRHDLIVQNEITCLMGKDQYFHLAAG